MSPGVRVAHWIFQEFLLDDAARGEDTAFVIHRGMKGRGHPGKKRHIHNHRGEVRLSHAPTEPPQV